MYIQAVHRLISVITKNYYPSTCRCIRWHYNDSRLLTLFSSVFPFFSLFTTIPLKIHSLAVVIFSVKLHVGFYNQPLQANFCVKLVVIIFICLVEFESGTCSLATSAPVQMCCWSILRARPRPFAAVQLCAGRPGRSPWAACVCRCSEELPEEDQNAYYVSAEVFRNSTNYQTTQSEICTLLLSDRGITFCVIKSVLKKKVKKPWCCLALAQCP